MENSDEQYDYSDYWDMFVFDEVQAMACDKIYVTIDLNNVPVKLKIDTSARCNVMPLDTLNTAIKQINKHETVSLVAYGGDTFKTKGTVTFTAHHHGIDHKIKFHVVDRCNRKTLLG